MATKATKASEAVPVGAPDKPPAGFELGGTPEVNGWYSTVEGVAVQGQIVGSINIGERRIVLVRLQHAVEAVYEGDIILLEPGQVLGVGLKHQLREMLEYVEHKGHVWFRPTGKRSLPGGRSMWLFDLAFRGRKGAIPPTVASSTSDDDDDPPF